ncbi:6,7-dimethyl-8-ribityllumazine synthase [Halotalea alkalilenta]|uniref:6,7-dimethyl-8-ribityllumazine synthase n=1 Tax=Halotalea alkalilenta TaxID=376489 RepID=UPI0004804311|nr:6,7-dimethyl-8-ribityllumazine synthase [Halotalea alkalilenta]
MNQPVNAELASSTATRFSTGRIAFIQAGWHADIVDNARIAFFEEYARQGFDTANIDRFEVAGAFEIPLLAKKLAASGEYAAVIAAGFVVDGGIYRHDFVADAVIKALMQVGLETGVPVLSAVLTPLRFHEHAEHQNFFREHFKLKGVEVANACIKTIETHAALPA